MFRDLLLVAVELWPHVQDLQKEVSAAMADGELTAQEARDLGHAFSDKVNITIRVKGRDVVRKQAQKELLGGVARVLRQTLIAAQGS